jgi:hypothetical protein
MRNLYVAGGCGERERGRGSVANGCDGSMAAAWFDDEGVDVTGEGVCTKERDGVDTE